MSRFAQVPPKFPSANKLRQWGPDESKFLIDISRLGTKLPQLPCIAKSSPEDRFSKPIRLSTGLATRCHWAESPCPSCEPTDPTNQKPAVYCRPGMQSALFIGAFTGRLPRLHALFFPVEKLTMPMRPAVETNSRCVLPRGYWVHSAISELPTISRPSQAAQQPSRIFQPIWTNPTPLAQPWACCVFNLCTK